MNTGAFFGCPEDVKSREDETPLSQAFCDWLDRSETRIALKDAIVALTRGTGLEGAYPAVFESAKAAFEAGRRAFRDEWTALREEAQVSEEAARKGVEMQLKRLCREHLLKELANRRSCRHMVSRSRWSHLSTTAGSRASSPSRMLKPPQLGATIFLPGTAAWASANTRPAPTSSSMDWFGAHRASL